MSASTTTTKQQQQQQRIGSFIIVAFIGIHDNSQYSGRTQPCVSKQALFNLLNKISMSNIFVYYIGLLI